MASSLPDQDANANIIASQHGGVEVRTKRETNLDIGYRYYHGKWWTPSDCTYLDSLRDVTLDHCIETCSMDDDCTGLHYSDESGQFCRMVNCSDTKTEPSGDSPYHNAYAKEKGYIHYPEMFWKPMECPYLGSYSNVTLAACIEKCSRKGDCTGLQFSEEDDQNCTLVNCPDTKSEPTGRSLRTNSYKKGPGCWFGADHYGDGFRIQGICVFLACYPNENGEFKFKFEGYNLTGCLRCNLWGDPHFGTYANNGAHTYHYYGLGEHLLSKPKIVPEVPAIKSDFWECVTDLSCAKSVTLENDAKNNIKIEFDTYRKTMTVWENGVKYNSLLTSPWANTIGHDNKVLIWMDAANIVILGSSGYLMKMYPQWIRIGHIDIYVTKAFEKEQEGLCVQDPQKGRRKRAEEQYQNRCERNPSVEEGFKSQVIEAMNNAESDLTQGFIESAVIDLCNMEDPAAYMKSVVVGKIKEEIRVKTITVDNPINITTPAPSPIHPSTVSSTVVEPPEEKPEPENNVNVNVHININ